MTPAQAHLILDGTLIASNRCAEQATSLKGHLVDRWYSGKAHQHGGTIQALTEPGGFPLWLSAVEPRSVHDITAARKHVLGALCKAAQGLPTLADLGYEGAGTGVLTPRKRPTGGQAPIPPHVLATCCYAPCAAKANTASPSSPSSGTPCGTSLPAQARSATSPKPRSSSPTSNTADSPEISEITSL
jgi:hypothetical protein